MAVKEVITRYGKRVGYSEPEIKKFHEGGHRTRQVLHLSRAAGKYSIMAEVVESYRKREQATAGSEAVLHPAKNEAYL